MGSAFAVLVLPFLCLPMKCSSPVKLYSGSASAGFFHTSWWEISTSIKCHVSFNVFPAGQEINSFWGEKKCISLYSEVFRCAEELHLIPIRIWVLAFLC